MARQPFYHKREKFNTLKDFSIHYNFSYGSVVYFRKKNPLLNATEFADYYYNTHQKPIFPIDVAKIDRKGRTFFYEHRKFNKLRDLADYYNVNIYTLLYKRSIYAHAQQGIFAEKKEKPRINVIKNVEKSTVLKLANFNKLNQFTMMKLPTTNYGEEA